jgi:protein-arginine kinase activator protein McsA
MKDAATVGVVGPIFTSAMNRDLTAIFEEWEYRPGHLSARIINGEDGEPRIQVRLDLGVLQMGLEGRPDGIHPFGFISLLDYYEAMYERVDLVAREDAREGRTFDSEPEFESGMSSDESDEPKGRGSDRRENGDIDREESGDDDEEDSESDQIAAEAGVPPGWPPPRNDMGDDRPLAPDECRVLREEVSQFNQRAVALMALEDYARVFRDAKRNLRVIDLCKDKAATEQDRNALEQFRTYFIAMMHRSLALEMMRANEEKAALLTIEEGLEKLKTCFAQAGKAKMMEMSVEFQTLKELRDAISPKLPISQRAELKQRLARAVEQENYKLAAILRDELKQLKDDPAGM